MAGLVEPKKVTGGAFGRFLAEKREELSKECKGQPATAICKLASERFKALDESSRAEYEAKYKQAQEQYTKDLEAFLAAGGEKKDIKRKAKGKDDEEHVVKKQKQDPNAPKKPAGGGYGCFLAKNREAFTKECEGQPVTAISKLAGERWKTLSLEEKKVFDEEYAAKKEKYAEEMKGYVPPVQEKVENTPKKKPTKSNENAKKTPAKPAVNNDKKAAKGGNKGKKIEPPAPTLESTVAAKAEKAGMTSPLLQLLSRQDMIDSGKSQSEMLDALVTSAGLIHPARRALLGA